MTRNVSSTKNKAYNGENTFWKFVNWVSFNSLNLIIRYTFFGKNCKRDFVDIK